MNAHGPFQPNAPASAPLGYSFSPTPGDYAAAILALPRSNDFGTWPGIAAQQPLAPDWSNPDDWLPYLRPPWLRDEAAHSNDKRDETAEPVFGAFVRRPSASHRSDQSEYAERQSSAATGPLGDGRLRDNAGPLPQTIQLAAGTCDLCHNDVVAPRNLSHPRRFRRFRRYETPPKPTRHNAVYSMIGTP
jgi:hypothetical protein